MFKNINRTIAFILAVMPLLLFLGISHASAQPITVPTGLDPGDQYRLVFVTSGTRDATSADIDVYNEFVTDEANTSLELDALGTTWTAIASTSSVDARSNTQTDPITDGDGVPIYNLNDERIATGNPDLWDGEIEDYIRFTQLMEPDSYYVWTGSYSTGLGGSDTTLGSAYPIIGYTSSRSEHWIYHMLDISSHEHHLYAMSDVLTVPTSVPEPATMLLIGTGLVGLAGVRRKFRNQ